MWLGWPVSRSSSHCVVVVPLEGRHRDRTEADVLRAKTCKESGLQVFTQMLNS